MAEPLDDCAAKLRRVEDQLIDLKRSISQYSRKPYTVVSKPYIKKRQVVHRIGSIEAVPAIIPICAGEIIHNLRCPLDYLLRRLLTRARGGRTPPFGSFFPICKNEGEWNDWLGRNTHASLAPTDLASLKKLQPYAGRYPDWTAHPLMLLKTLSNIDKHDVLPAALTMGNIVRSRIAYPEEEVWDMHQFVLGQALKPGTVILVQGWSQPRLPHEVDMEHELTCDVFFDKGCGGGTNRSIYQTLKTIRAYIQNKVFVKPGLIDGFVWDFTPRKPLI